MRFWRRLVNDRGSREAWEAELAWFRVRYLDRSDLERCIRLLSSAQTCGRVASYYLPDAGVSRLYIGVPKDRNELLQRMSAGLNFSITVAPAMQPPPISVLAPADQLPWDRPFYAHIVEGHLFVDGTENEKNAEQASYLPVAPKGKEAPDGWRLLQPPPVGLSMIPSWNGRHAPAKLRATTTGVSGWPMGRSQDGMPMFAGNRVNLYGSSSAVAGWLVCMAEHLLREKPSGLIIIDGKGDLGPTLKRKAAVTRLLGKQLTYVDIDGAVVTGGFNPLAPVPGESKAETLQRRQRWFGGMGVHREGVRLLARARGQAVSDIVTLQRWLQQPSQQHFAAGVSGLQSALRRLQADPTLREWFSWPTNVFAGLPEGALLLACHGSGWGRKQLLAMAGLAAASLPETRLILHGFPWSASGPAPAEFDRVKQLLVSNGPVLEESTIVLTRTEATAAGKLAQRFLGDDALAAENLQLLRDEEAVVARGKRAVPVQWRVPARDLEKK